MTDQTDLPFQMLPRTIQRHTPLHGQVTILYPAIGPAYLDLAESLARTIDQRVGVGPEVLADTALMPSRSTQLPDSYRQRTLILLGNLNTNRALLPLYARYYCATDATYPGGDGYDLRTIVNPYGTGSNVILAGGSTLQGVTRAVERLKVHVANQQDDRLPFLLEVELAPDIAQALMQWPDTPLGAPIPTVEESMRKTHALTQGLMQAIGSYGIMYTWTGDERYGLYARDCLRALNAQADDSYGDWHYRAERVLRVLPWLCAGGFLDQPDIQHTDDLLLGTALGTQDNWWRMRHGRPPLGHRHHGRGTYEFLLLARYLKDQANPGEAVRELCDRWIAECREYLDALGRAGIDDQDDESTLTNLATVFWYALSEERFDFFESGSARLVAERAIALHDNMGAGAGQGGYGEGLPGTMYLQQEATVPVAACAFYYQDGGLKWILEHLPHLKRPLISGFLHFSPLFMHMFDTELPAEPPDGLIGLRRLPITPHQYEINVHPPEHIEHAGHSMDAPETWLRAEGIGINTLPRERGFDKIVLRSGLERQDPYLLLQGYQGGYRWQGHMRAANCIVRFSQAGHIFLIQNTSRHSHYYKNGVFISDGFNNDPLPPIAEWLSVDDFAGVGLSTTRLKDFHHADWTRHLFWIKPDLFVVIDAIVPQADGPYSFTGTWRTPGYAELDGRAWRARQGDHVFTLRWPDSLPVTSEEETDQGAAVPYVLRQFRAGDFKAGEVITFQNLFYVRLKEKADEFDLHRLDSRQALITRNAVPFCWCGISGADGEIRGLGIRAYAVNAWSSDGVIALSGTTNLKIEGGWHFESERPVGIYLDLDAAQVTVRLDSPDQARSTLRIFLGGTSRDFILEGDTVISLGLPVETCQQIAEAIRERLSALHSTESSGKESQQPLTADSWRSGWTFDGVTPIPERIRDVTISADPPPLDGFAEQLVDTVVAEIRQTSQQWPTADKYDITLAFPTETAVDRLRIIGDSYIEPTLRTFHPLPDGISAMVSSDGFERDVRPCEVEPEPGSRRYKLYRDVEDRLETRQVAVGQQARQIRVLVPAPPDGQPLVLHEIEIYGAQRIRPPIQHLLAVDGLILVNAADELSALSNDGAERWRQRLSGLVTHLSCHELGGRPAICLGILGGELRILETDGSLRQSIPLAKQFQQRRDAYFGRVNAINDVQVWHREPDGRAALVVGGYSVMAFLDPDGKIIGHSWADGSWQTNILVDPQSRDLWVRCGWNHGIGVYEGKPGLAPSGETISFGGVAQPMFRGLRKVIPFVNGKSVTYEWTAHGILAAAENGAGVLSITIRDWCWKIEGGVPISACIQIGDEVIVGGMDGFIAAFAVSDGRPLRRLQTGSPVVGLAPMLSGLAVATRKGLLSVGSDWRIQDFHRIGIRKFCRLGNENLLIVRDDGVLEMLVYEAVRERNESQ